MLCRRRLRGATPAPTFILLNCFDTLKLKALSVCFLKFFSLFRTDWYISSRPVLFKKNVSLTLLYLFEGGVGGSGGERVAGE